PRSALWLALLRAFVLSCFRDDHASLPLRSALPGEPASWVNQSRSAGSSPSPRCRWCNAAPFSGPVRTRTQSASCNHYMMRPLPLSPAAAGEGSRLPRPARAQTDGYGGNRPPPVFTTLFECHLLKPVVAPLPGAGGRTASTCVAGDDRGGV